MHLYAVPSLSVMVVVRSFCTSIPLAVMDSVMHAVCGMGTTKVYRKQSAAHTCISVSGPYKTCLMQVQWMPQGATENLCSRRWSPASACSQICGPKS